MPQWSTTPGRPSLWGLRMLATAASAKVGWVIARMAMTSAARYERINLPFQGRGRNERRAGLRPVCIIYTARAACVAPGPDGIVCRRVKISFPQPGEAHDGDQFQ